MRQPTLRPTKLLLSAAHQAIARITRATLARKSSGLEHQCLVAEARNNFERRTDARRSMCVATIHRKVRPR
jgi:hypothetical protein